MDASDAVVKGAGGRDKPTHTQLRGWPLWAARAVWIVLVVLTVVMLAAAAPLNLETLSTSCAAAQCGQQQLGPALARALQEQLGITLDVYAWYYTILNFTFPLPFLVVALVIFWRKSADWLALLVSLWLAMFAATGSPALDPLAQAQPILLWPLALVRVIGIGLFVVVFYLFPDGRFVPRWTRWLVPVWLAVIATLVVQGKTFDNVVPILISFASGAVAQIYRYVRVSTPPQRQQTKWVMLAVSAMTVVVTLGLIPSFFLRSPADGSATVASTLYGMVEVAFFLIPPLTLLPLSFAFSILRYRLWDVDFVINRSLVYGGLTAILVALFGGAFFLVQTLLQSVMVQGQGFIAAGIAGAAAVILFNPARKWLRGFVDSRLYGIKVDYRRADTPTLSPVAASHSLRTKSGDYENLQSIGRGGMAEIYRANHPTLGKPVAIKILPANLAKQADFRKRFEREARLVAGLKHPNIVQMYDFGESDGTHYMVMELIAGSDLGEVIHRTAPLPVERVRTILEETASALDYAHGQGLVHRDIKPSNVMLEPVTGRGERAVLMDFGIARIISGQTRLTATGMMGTFDYMSPEQINDSREVDARADVYALGIMSYQMLTGKLPFTAGSTGALLMLHLRQPPPDPRELVPDLPESVCAAVVRAMDKKPEKRFQTAGEFARTVG